MVRLDYKLTLDYEVVQPTEFIFQFEAVDTPFQTVDRRELRVSPNVPFTIETSTRLASPHLRLHAESGPLQVRYSALVDIEHYVVPPTSLLELPIPELPIDVLHYTYPSRYCPADRFYDIALSEFGAMQPGYGRVQAICDFVRNRTRFQVGITNSFHSAIDTYQDQVGVCRDFAHLMITLCRALNIPARFVTSVDYGADPALGPPDFHAYVEVYLSERWYIFDPSGLSTTTGLVRIATGRDATDVAFATIFGKVLWTIPKIEIFAVVDAVAGTALPQPPTQGISTAGPERMSKAELHQGRTAASPQFQLDASMA